MDIYGRRYESRMMLGTALYPSPAVMRAALSASGAALVTVSLRREQARPGGGSPGFWSEIRELGADFLPNTAGCHSVREAVTTARMGRELLGTDLVKLEVIGHSDTLQPDVFALVEAARILSDEGFHVLPYTTLFRSGRDDGADGARTAGYRSRQARGHRPCRHAAARRLRAG